MIVTRGVELWTEADITNLRAAIASGVLSVSYAGPPARTVTYQSLDSMRKLLADMVRTVTGPSSYRLVAWRKGFDDVSEEGSPDATGTWRRR
jgi:hypothetical protein